MDALDAALIKRFKELSNNAEMRGIYLFTDFLNVFEQSALLTSGIKNASLFGGFDDAERKIAVFGNENETGYAPQIPVSCIKLSPLNKKFSDELSHRDVLGALMNLGIKREALGDIVFFGGDVYVFCLERMSPFIAENLSRIKHTSITCETDAVFPENAGGNLSERVIIVASPRIDAIIGGVFNLSRSTSAALVSGKKVFVNGRLCESPSFSPKENDAVSVRGYGKFKWLGTFSETKKGRDKAKVAVYC